MNEKAWKTIIGKRIQITTKSNGTEMVTVCDTDVEKSELHVVTDDGTVLILDMSND